VAELPPLAVEISEHRLQRLRCPGCGRVVRAELPPGVPRGCFGPKLEAAIAVLTVRNRLSRRQLVELLNELFGCPIAVGTIDAILTRTAETLGLDGLEVTWNVFRACKRFQQDGDRAALRRRVQEIKVQMRLLLEWGSIGKRQRHVRALAKKLLKLWPALWTFADVPDVDPSNNAAERGLRAAVIYRKLSLGSRSQGGERTIERLLSVDQTCRLQRRSLYAYLSDALTAKARGDPVPTLT
jgi:hypothetical protein